MHTHIQITLSTYIFADHCNRKASKTPPKTTSTPPTTKGKPGSDFFLFVFLFLVFGQSLLFCRHTSTADREAAIARQKAMAEKEAADRLAAITASARGTQKRSSSRLFSQVNPSKSDSDEGDEGDYIPPTEPDSEQSEQTD
jgi:hypothetical protein